MNSFYYFKSACEILIIIVGVFTLLTFVSYYINKQSCMTKYREFEPVYSYCARVNCGKKGKWRIYSPFALTCTECGHPLKQCDFPHDPTAKDAGQKNKEFLERWIKQF